MVLVVCAVASVADEADNRNLKICCIHTIP